MDIPRNGIGKPLMMPQQPLIGLLKLVDGIDIGLIGTGISSKVVKQDDGTSVVEFWLTVSLGQPSALGGVNQRGIALRMVGNVPAQLLIDKFLELQKEANGKNNLVVVPG